VFTVGQKATFEYMGTNFLVTVTGTVVDGQSDKERVERGMLVPSTTFAFDCPASSGIKVTNQYTSVMKTSLFKSKDFNFASLGIGVPPSRPRLALRLRQQLIAMYDDAVRELTNWRCEQVGWTSSSRRFSGERSAAASSRRTSSPS
jgi:hypothetical protein